MARETNKHLVYSTKTKKFSKWHRPLSRSMASQIRAGIREAADPNLVVKYNSWDDFISEMEALCR